MEFDPYALALLLVAVLALAYFLAPRGCGRDCRCERCAARRRYTDPDADLRAEIGQWVDANRGKPFHDLKHETPVGPFRVPFHGSGSPNESHAARGKSQYADVETAALRGGLWAADAASFNYDDFTRAGVISARQAENHSKWVSEMRPYSGSNLIVRDALDVEASLPFRGLQRPQAVAVSPNAAQITDHIHMEDLLHNKKFKFVA